MAHIDNVKQEIGLNSLFQCTSERCHQMRRELPDKPNGIDKKNPPMIVQRQRADRGIQGGEESVFDKDFSISQDIEQTGFPHVGIPHQGYLLVILASFPAYTSLHFNLAEFLLQMADPFPDGPSVHFQLGFSRTPRTDPSLLAGEMRPLTRQPGKEILQLS